MSQANDQLHGRAIAAAQALKKATTKAGDYNSRRREATLDYGRVMSEVWARLEAGEDVGGITSKEAFCLMLGTKMRWTQTAIRRHQISIGALSAPEPTRTVNLDKADCVVFGGQKFGAREFAEAIRVALTAGGPKSERTEGTLSLRERLCEASGAWETARGADLTNDHLKAHAREEEATKQAKKSKVHFKDKDGMTCPVARKRGSKCLTSTDESQVTCAACLSDIRSGKEFDGDVEERRNETHGADAKRPHLTRCRWFLVAETKVSDSADEITCEDCKKLASSLGATSRNQAETAAAAD